MIDLGTMLLASAAAASGTIPLVVRQLCAPPEDVSLRDSRRTELGLSDHLPFWRLESPELMKTTYNALGAMYEVVFNDTSVMSDDDRIRHCARLNDALHKVGQKAGETGWMIHTHELCMPAEPLEMPAYVPSDGRRVLAESHIEYVAPMRAATRDLISITYLPPSAKSSKLADLLVTGEPEVAATFAKTCADFGRGLEMVEDSLRQVGRIRRLGTHPKHPERNEFLEAVFQVLFDDPQPIFVGVPFDPFDVGGLLAARDISPAGIRPKVGDKHLRVLSIFGHPSSTTPALLDAYRRAARPGCRFSTRMVFQDSEVSKEKLLGKKRKWTGKKTSLIQAAMPGGAQKKVDRIADYNEKRVDDAMFISGTSAVSWVHFSAKVVFLNEDLEAMTEDVRNVRKALQGAGFSVNLETINTLDAYFGHIPFDGHHDVREGLAHTVNASRIWATSSRWAGRKTWACKNCGPITVPALVGISDTGEDFFFDPHDEDSQSFVAYGSPGSGKTTILNKMAAEYIRAANDQVFSVDKNFGQFVTCKFLGGTHYEDARYWLFGDLDNPAKQQYLAQYLSFVCELAGQRVENRKPILDALKNMLEDDPWNRSLTSFLGFLGPYDKGGMVTQTLAEYARGGVHGGILDGEYNPHVGTNSYEVHELGRLLTGNANERVAAPVLIWVLKSFEDRLLGQRSMIFVDEAWAAMRSPLVGNVLEECLRTLRYRHAGLGLFTHQLADVASSPIGKIVNAACKTKLIFPNLEASGALRDFFERDLEMTESQIQAIRQGVLKRDCALVTSGGFGMFRTPLSPAEAAIFGTTGADEVAKVKALIADDPTTWRERHLAARDCTKEAARLRALRLHNNVSPYSIKEAIA